MKHVISNLDTVSKKLIFDILQEEKITIINSTHNKSEFDYDFELKINIMRIIQDI